MSQELSDPAPGQRQAVQRADHSPVVEKMSHDLLNQNQVALGYIELAMERPGLDDSTLCMLERAIRAIKKCGDLALDIHKLTTMRSNNGQVMQSGLKIKR
jgi:hypothetical protein